MSLRGGVFVAEDDPSMRTLLEHAARRAGHATVGCGNADQLLQRLGHALDRGSRPVLVLSDHRMPGRLGLEIVEIVHGWGWRVPFVLVTAFPDADLVARASQAGAAAVLSKPASLASLIATVQRFAAPAARIGAANTDDPYLELGGSD